MKAILAAALAASACALVACDDRSSNRTTTAAPAANPSARQPDNSGVNTRDRGSGTLTPTDQAQGTDADRKITTEVRRAITDDSSMSVNARNVKIITLDGKVTLRGPVATQAERDAIEAKAKSVPGVTTVDNQLEVKSP